MQRADGDVGPLTNLAGESGVAAIAHSRLAAAAHRRVDGVLELLDPPGEAGQEGLAERRNFAQELIESLAEQTEELRGRYRDDARVSLGPTKQCQLPEVVALLERCEHVAASLDLDRAGQHHEEQRPEV